MSRVPPESLTAAEVAEELRQAIATEAGALEMMFRLPGIMEPRTVTWIEAKGRRRIAALERAHAVFAGYDKLAAAEQLSALATAGVVQ